VKRSRDNSASKRNRQRGVALLAVLWLSVALTMIAMTTAYLVRTEASAVGNHIEAERAGLLAHGAVEAAIYAILHPSREIADASGQTTVAQQFHPGQRQFLYQFEQGAAEVQVMPENAKLDVNQASAEQLAALFQLLGMADDAASELAAAVIDWRTPRASDINSEFDLFYAGLPKPYTARHAAFDELEELLAVKGMSRELYFGRLIASTDGKWSRTPPLADLLTTEPEFRGVNILYAPYEVLRVLPAWNEPLARAVIDARERVAPEALLESVPGLSSVAAVSPVVIAPGLAYTLTGTAGTRDSAVRHTVRARIRLDRLAPMGCRVTGWWEDWPWSSESSSVEAGATQGVTGGAGA
jgi:general secretion pathway protein K